VFGTSEACWQIFPYYAPQEEATSPSSAAALFPTTSMWYYFSFSLMGVDEATVVAVVCVSSLLSFGSYEARAIQVI
jgi:hypothetical protein